MTRPRTVTLTTLDHGEVTLPEPSWCAGHDDHRPVHRVDLAHAGPIHRLTHNGALLWTAFVGQAPYASHPDQRGAGVYASQEGYAETLTPSGLYDLAASLEAHADRLRELADQLTTILDAPEVGG